VSTARCWLLAGAVAALAIRPAAAQQPDPVAFARQAPDSAREQLRRRFAMTVSAPAAQRAAQLAAARDLAGAYASAWSDSILVRLVDRFERWPARERGIKVLADSLRREGVTTFPRAGPAAALALWHRSRRYSASIGDSAGLAAVHGNLGAGYLMLGELDSARSHLARSHAIALRLRDWRTLGNALGALGSLEQAEANDAAAHTAFTDALAIRGRSGDDRGAAADENNLGLLAESAGDTAGARRWYGAALARNRRAARGGAAAANLANLAGLDIARGAYADAAARYREALALHRKAGEEYGAALDLRDIGGLELRQGRYREAVTAFAEAVTIFARTGPPHEAIGARADLAQAHAAAGEPAAALRILDRAVASARRADEGSRALLALVRGDVFSDIDAPDAAEAAYGRAASLYLAAGDTAGATAARQGLGALLLRRGDHRGASRALAAAAREQRASGDDRGAALTDLVLGRALVELGDTADAAAMLRRARVALRRLGDPVGEAAAHVALGDLAERRGLRHDAEASYRAGLARLSGRIAPAVAVQLRWGLARTLRAGGRLDAAAKELELAIGAIEQMAGPLAAADPATPMQGQTGALYVELALIEHARGRNAAAFATSERLRSRQMRELVARGVVARPAGVDTRLVESERQLRGRMVGLGAGGGVFATRSARMRDAAASVAGAGSGEELAATQSAYGELLARLGASAPQYAALLMPPSTSHRDVAARLERGEALLEYMVSDSTTLLFVVTRDSLRVFPIAIGRDDLAAAIDFARAAITRRPAGRTREPWGPPLRRLHRLLVEPAEAAGALRGIRTLIFAPHGELHFLPFAALMGPPGTAMPYLVERYEIAYVPSAAVWTQLGARAPAPPNGKVLVVAPFPGTLPGSRDEAAGIRRVYGREATVMIGPRATQRAFEAAAPAYSTVHLATYGVLDRRNPLLSYVAFAPEAGRAGTGELAVEEVFGLSLRARLLVLSACETALGAGVASDVPPGDDWVGLVRAFLFAGADNVMATLWPIEDRSTSLIIPRFYGSFAGGSVSRSLALAQRAALRDPATAAPRHWAAFVLVGAVR